jgi:hypothetical protein
MRRLLTVSSCLVAACVSAQAPRALTHRPAPGDPIQFVFTSDAHYGLPEAFFPADGGLRSGEKIGTLDFVVEGGDVTRTIASESVAEQTALEAFIRKHKNVTAYFHGHSNWNQFYEWTGPEHTIRLPVFRVDSPMKGKFSAADETKLSFQVATIDPSTLRMTVRECLWNQGAAITWGAVATVALGAPLASTRD